MIEKKGKEIAEMILIKLEDLLKEYNLNISEVSDATGIARSTLTPLVNNPETVKGLKIETIDTLCDFFGISLDELLEFKQEKLKYFIQTYWYNDDFNKYTFLFGKKIGSKIRYSLLQINITGFSFDNRYDKGAMAIAETTFFTKEKTEEFLESVDDPPEFTSFPDKKIIESDTYKQPDKNIKIITKIIFDLIKDKIIQIELFKKASVAYFKILWEINQKHSKRKLEFIYDISTSEVSEYEDKIINPSELNRH